MAQSTLNKLVQMRANAGSRRTIGLTDEVVERFASSDMNLQVAVDTAYEAQLALLEESPELLAMSEPDLRKRLQADYVNFYSDDSLNPYVPLAAKGPWVVTAYGAVLHDNGGYGMLGFGHAPTDLLAAMAKPWVMANIMTPAISQLRFGQKLRNELGHSRGGCPFDRFMCLNSGSEAVTLACRIADINSATQTAPGARHAGKTVKYLSLAGSFHGRTFLPARASDSTRKTYTKHLHSFQEASDLITVSPNDCDGLRQVFAYADDNDIFIELMLMEPVQGEGCPGQAASREFYDLARQLTKEHGTLLLIDSIQAGLRATGALSIVDYPGFEDCEIPDMETWSKALNGGQYPLSVLGCNTRAAELYQRGVYGNTMTSNPRALEVGCAVLDLVTPELRANVRARGEQVLAGLTALQQEMPSLITVVQGTGLLCAAELDPTKCAVVGYGGIEELCRVNGVGVIHGGKNALRFTPHFSITEDEVELMLRVVGDVLRGVSAA